MTLKVSAFKFVAHEVPPKRDDIINDAPAFLALNLVKHSSNCDTLLRTGRVRILGWEYDFREYLHKYVVKQEGYIGEYYCTSKTTLRKCLYGHVHYILDLPEQYY